jgi:hypothetical protein
MEMIMTKILAPPFTEETARAKVQAAKTPGTAAIQTASGAIAIDFWRAVRKPMHF